MKNYSIKRLYRGIGGIKCTMYRFAIYSVWHNFRKPFRINKSKKNKFQTHAEAAGLTPEESMDIAKRLFDGSRILYFTIEKKLNPFQKKLWNRELINPVDYRAV